MPDLQFSMPLQETEISNLNPRILALWLFQTKQITRAISPQEILWAKKLPSHRSIQYQHSRGAARYALSTLFKVPPLDIPLLAKPGQPPELPNGWGYVSLSHCSNALLIGWCSSKIGVDIERQNRKVKAQQLINRFLSTREKQSFKDVDTKTLQKAVLEQWTIKEAAIKWQRGKLFKDFCQWYYFNDSHIAKHQLSGDEVRSQTINHEQWLMAIAVNQKIHTNTMLCIE